MNSFQVTIGPEREDELLPIRTSKQFKIHIDCMLKLKLKSNQYCLLSHKEEDGEMIAIGKVWPFFNEDEQEIILTPSLSRNLKVCNGQHVNLNALDIQNIEIIDKVILNPISEVIKDLKDFEIYIDQILFALEYLTIEETIEINLSGKPYLFKVQSINEKQDKKIGRYNEKSKLEIKIQKQIKESNRKQINIGGIKKEIGIITNLIKFNFEQEDLLNQLNIKPTKGILLFGPPGTGKTLLAKSMAEHFNVNTTLVSAPALSSRFVGETEQKIKDLFIQAQLNQPSIICIDEIDALCPKRDDSQTELEKRTVATFLTLMDGISNKNQAKIMVIGTTNRIHSIDSALRRPGRFDVELEIGIPTVDDRYDILKSILNQSYHNLKDEQIDLIAKKAHGYVGADLASLIKEAGLLAIKRNINEQYSDVDKLILHFDDVLNSFNLVKPSAMREISLEIPKVYWHDIGGQKEIQKKLIESVEWPLKRPEMFLKFGISPPKGILFYGPPGCSKTLMAKALATESGLNFLLVKGPELFNKYVGQSEKNLKEMFRKARQAQPSILFFDELDALTTKRENSNSSSSVQERVLAQFLVELDGIDPLNHVTVIGATNRPDVIDSALLRPGRMDRILYVGPPNLESRKEIFNIQSKNMPFNKDVDINWLAEQTEGFSGAEVVNLCQEAAMDTILNDINEKTIGLINFQNVFRKGIKKSISKEMLKFYDDFKSGSQLSSI